MHEILAMLVEMEKVTEDIRTVPKVGPVYHSFMSDSATLWTVACQAPLSMEFSRQEYCSELPFPSPGDLPDLGI